ncbi:putative ribonuclease H-like domain-containing protein [Tanacetum coccineum]
MSPKAVLMKTGLKSVNTARLVNTVRSVNTGRPFSTASWESLDGKSDEGTFSNDFAVNKDFSDSKYHLSQQDQDCIVMPIWKDASYFGDDAPRSVADAQIQDKDRLQDENDATEKSHEDSSLEDNGTADQQVNTARPEVNTGSRDVSTAVPEVNTATPEDLVGPSHASEDTQVEDQEIELGNIPQSYAVPTTPHTRIHKSLIDHVVGDVPVLCSNRRNDISLPELGFLVLYKKRRTHKDFIHAFCLSIRAIGTKWVYRNKKDERGIVIRNKARLVAQGHTQEEGIDYDEPPGFEDPDHPDKVYKVVKALYGLHQAPRAWPDIMFAVCACARFQVSPKTSHLLAVKRIFRYLKGKPSLGLWYPKDSPLELVAYTDSDYAGADIR